MLLYFRNLNNFTQAIENEDNRYKEKAKLEAQECYWQVIGNNK